MEERTITLVLIVLGTPVWLVAMWALVMTVVGALNDERFTLFRLFTGYFVQEPYNRKYVHIFAACIGFLVCLGVVFNVLYFSGVVRLTDIRLWSN